MSIKYNQWFLGKNARILPEADSGCHHASKLELSLKNLTDLSCEIFSQNPRS